MAKRVFDTLWAAQEVKTFHELTDVFASPLRDIGFAYFSVVEASSLPKNLTLTVLFGQPDVAWYEAYVRERLGRMDPRMRHMLGSAEPAFLSELTPHANIGPDHQFLERFGAHGHAESYVWPVHLPEGRVRAVLLLSDLAELGVEARVAAGALASSFHAAGARLLRGLAIASTSGVELRARQRECLRWARQGKSSADIGQILGISARTVDEHISRTCEALGVRTRIQAVARAVMLGLI